MFELTNEVLIQSLIFVVAFFVTFLAMNKFLKNKGLSIIIGIVIAMFALLYLDYSRMSSIFNIYGMTGVIILIFVPLVVAFFFIYSSEIVGILRKLFWIFYGVMNIMILQKNNYYSSETITFIILLLAFIFGILVIFDRAIKNRFETMRNLRRRP